ncbi:DUF3592 domain-containing protein [Archangium violaceum]|uniref:DUF3592 domain-containing protein n=1 Tax=Archangium violaceum TaxID=83451 RepID=UPI00193C6BA0|nr:DUF3592 domain-containing protein [Archangium violaceum]QRK07915.1 DUF3592 domain-containing protein [Archangium violaceum]
MNHKRRSWRILLGLVLCLMGVYGGHQLIDRAEAEPLQPPSQSDTPSPLEVVMLLVAGLLGVGGTAYGVRQLRREGQLLREGVPVLGTLTHVTQDRESSHRILIYRFEDETGVVREGSYETSPVALLEDYEAGQAVTVLYDPTDPRINMVDEDHVRRAEARVRGP